MATITVLPHEELCPEGATFEAPAGISLCQALLDQHIEIEHACAMSCACTTCHVVVREGYDDVNEASDVEEDLLDMAWGLDRAHEGVVALVDACRIAGRQDQFITPTADDGMGRFGGASCRGPCLGHGRGRRQCPAGSR